jgi:hypothetical protein
VVSIGLFDGRVPTQPRMDGSGPEGRQKPRSPSRNGSAGFFPLPQRGVIPRGTKKLAAAVLRCAAGLTAAGRSLPGPRTAIEAAMVAARQQRKRVEDDDVLDRIPPCEERSMAAGPVGRGGSRGSPSRSTSGRGARTAKFARPAHGLGYQQQLADEAGIAGRTLIRIENSEQAGSDRTMGKLRSALERHGTEFPVRRPARRRC